MSEYKEIIPGQIPIPELHQFLLGSVNPRPIAFVSTLDANGNRNLSPFSFFNVFSANPPIVVFSPARRGRDNTTKDTYENIKLNKECTVNIVSYNMVHQMVLSSSEYPSNVDEFYKAGFTPIESDLIKPFRVGEAPSQMECKVKEILNYGEVAGGGNLIVAEVVKMHVKQSVIGDDGKIDPFKIDTVGRCGKNWYSRPSKSLFAINNPRGTYNIGFDGLPENVKTSSVLSGNDLGQLGKQIDLPSAEEIAEFAETHPELKTLIAEQDNEKRLHTLAKSFISKGDVESAWKVLLSIN